LHKWASNEPLLVPTHKVPDQRGELTLNFSDKTDTKTLGLSWNCQDDSLKYQFQNAHSNNGFTKRTVLSNIAKIFDPLGLITPFVIQAKFIMQRLWTYKLDWDDPIPAELQERWVQFLTDLAVLKNISIPREIFDCYELTSIELHGFSDASLQGYGAVLYVKAQAANGSTSVKLLCAKNRVAPLKVITLPRLELLGALLLARLMNKTIDALNINISRCFLWTDSSIVLNWVARSAGTWQIFVGNRVAKIQSLTSDYEWRHVASQDNIPSSVVVL
jgi:hypothetical protein